AVDPCHASFGPHADLPLPRVAGADAFAADRHRAVQARPVQRVPVHPAGAQKDKPYLDGIDFNTVSNPSMAILSFIADRFDLTFPWEMTPDDRKLVRKDAPQAIRETTSMNLNLNLLINGTAAPFDNPDIRRAIVLALDRKAFVDTI